MTCPGDFERKLSVHSSHLNPSHEASARPVTNFCQLLPQAVDPEMHKDARMKPPVNGLIDAQKKKHGKFSGQLNQFPAMASTHGCRYHSIRMHADSGHCFLRSIVQQLPLVSRHWTDWTWDS